MYTDCMYGTDAAELLQWILHDLKSGSALGLGRPVFFIPRAEQPFRLWRYGVELATPFGVAAGPHTQLAQNCVAAWLTGARYLELKTVQQLDTLQVTKPCIHVGDAGYNCEWSQELRLGQSAAEYIKAWVLIHVLHHALGFSGGPAVLCNLSVGYSLEGIKSEPVQEFLHQVTHCGPAVQALQERLTKVYPPAAALNIADSISRSVTISCMHGCPPEEVENIALYFLREQGMHTTVKLNPTLLGAQRVHSLLHDCLGYAIPVPEQAFAHDLRYADALSMIRTCSAAAAKAGLSFGVKLTNTLETENKAGFLPPTEKYVYLSGRPLHVLAVNLAAQLRGHDENLDISFSAGGDAFNAPDLLAAGLMPLTVCSDLLKPGGYGRLSQYPARLEVEMRKLGATTLTDFILARAALPLQSNAHMPGTAPRAEQHSPLHLPGVAAAALHNLQRYATSLEQPDSPCRKECAVYSSVKTARPLPRFDCVAAPCKSACPLGQDIPQYLGLVAAGRMEEARQCIRATNPLPHVQGMVCDQHCQGFCTRVDYDRPLDIRGIKRFAMEYSGHSDDERDAPPNEEHRTQAEYADYAEHAAPAPSVEQGQYACISGPATGKRVAIVGAGPSGLACAATLAAYGVDVHIFETRDHAGGMAAHAIPAFRLAREALHRDMTAILRLEGVHLHTESPVDAATLTRLQANHDAVYVAVGAQQSQSLGIAGENSAGVWNQLSFLDAVTRGDDLNLGPHILVVGGGNAAMDVARAARRLRVPGQANPQVTIVYRRSCDCMPCDAEELLYAKSEGIIVRELLAPVRVLVTDNAVSGLEVQPMRLECPSDCAVTDAKQKARSMPLIPSGEAAFVLPASALIVAIGQRSLAQSLYVDSGKQSSHQKTVALYVGGDAARGASSLVWAMADGCRAARQIVQDFGQAPYPSGCASSVALHAFDAHMLHSQLDTRRARRDFGWRGRRAAAFGPHPVPGAMARGAVSATPPAPLSLATAMAEASRCLRCDVQCNMCVSVCPNRANVAVRTDMAGLKVPGFSGALALPVQEVLADVSGGPCRIRTIAQGQISQTFQIIHVADLCNECGNCATFCPTSGRPFKEKIRLHRSRESFESHGTGYFMAEAGRMEGRHQALRQSLQISARQCKKEGQSLASHGAQFLNDADNVFVYEDCNLRAELDPLNLMAFHAVLAEGCLRAALSPAVEMALVYLLVQHHPFLCPREKL